MWHAFMQSCRASTGQRCRARPAVFLAAIRPERLRPRLVALELRLQEAVAAAQTATHEASLQLWVGSKPDLKVPMRCLMSLAAPWVCKEVLA